MSRRFIPFVSHLTVLRDVRSETTAFSLTSVSPESHETNVRLYEAKRPFSACRFSSRFPRVFRQKSHDSHPYREVILRLSSKFAPLHRRHTRARWFFGSPPIWGGASLCRRRTRHGSHELSALGLTQHKPKETNGT